MRVPRPDLDAALVALTPRERQIVDYVAAGRPNKVIAIDLGISLRTAEAHRARIFAKLHTRNAMELACRLCAHGRSGASPILEAAAVDAAVAAERGAGVGAERGAERGAATGSRPALGMAGGRPMTGSPTLPADANLPIVSQPIIPGIYSAAMFPPMASSTTLHEPPLGYGVDPAAADDPTDVPTDDPSDEPAGNHD